MIIKTVNKRNPELFKNGWISTNLGVLNSLDYYFIFG